MIIKRVKGDVLASDHKHVAFAVNVEGVNDAGFAGAVSRGFWPELMFCGAQPLGKVMTKESGGKTFHAIVCHSLEKGGWAEAPAIVRKAMDSIAPDDFACVAIGGGLIGKLMGADTDDIIAAIDESPKKVTLYSL
jgi:hypothetical protein